MGQYTPNTSTRQEEYRKARAKRQQETELKNILMKDMSVFHRRLPVKPESRTLTQKKIQTWQDEVYRMRLSEKRWEKAAELFLPSFREGRFFISYYSTAYLLSHRPYVVAIYTPTIVPMLDRFIYFIRSYQAGIHRASFWDPKVQFAIQRVLTFGALQ